jgi:hypothetical protein
MTPASPLPPGVVLDAKHRYVWPCAVCGVPRSLFWQGTVVHEKRIRQQQCKACYTSRGYRSLPDEIRLDEPERTPGRRLYYLERCWKCERQRRLKWAGWEKYENARLSMCRECHREMHRSTEPDPLVVDMLVSGGYRLNAVRTERLQAFRALQQKHPTWPAWRYADRLGVTPRSIERYRAELRRERMAA